MTVTDCICVCLYVFFVYIFFKAVIGERVEKGRLASSQNEMVPSVLMFSLGRDTGNFPPKCHLYNSFIQCGMANGMYFKCQPRLS